MLTEGYMLEEIEFVHTCSLFFCAKCDTRKWSKLNLENSHFNIAGVFSCNIVAEVRENIISSVMVAQAQCFLQLLRRLSHVSNIAFKAGKREICPSGAVMCSIESLVFSLLAALSCLNTLLCFVVIFCGLLTTKCKLNNWLSWYFF